MQSERSLLRETCALLVLAIACSTVEVGADWDPGADFSSLRSWSWVPSAGNRSPSDDARLQDPLLQSRIRTAIEAVLSARQYRRTEGEPPDFYVTYHLAIDKGLDVRTTFDGVNPGGYYGAWGDHTTTVEQYDIGTLLIDVADASGKLVWRGKAQSRVQDIEKPEDRERRILDVVTQVLDRFPPDRADAATN